SEQSQRRGLPRVEWAGREKPWQRHVEGGGQCDRGRGADGAERHHAQDRRRPRQFPRPRLQRGRAMTRRSVILGVGSALPKRRVSNAELAQTVDTTDQWIVERTGIRSRYVAGDGETTATLAADASRRALDHA